MTVDVKSPAEQAMLGPTERARYVEARRADMRAEAASNAGTCVAEECGEAVDDSGYLCRAHRLQFTGWNYALSDHERQWEFYLPE